MKTPLQIVADAVHAAVTKRWPEMKFNQSFYGLASTLGITPESEASVHAEFASDSGLIFQFRNRVLTIRGDCGFHFTVPDECHYCDPAFFRQVISACEHHLELIARNERNEQDHDNRDMEYPDDFYYEQLDTAQHQLDERDAEIEAEEYGQ